MAGSLAPPERGESIDSSERFTNALYTVGNGQRLVMALPLVTGLTLMVDSRCCCFISIASSVCTLAGSAQKLLGLAQLWSARDGNPVGDDGSYAKALFVTVAEVLTGLLYIFCMMIGVSALVAQASPRVAEFVYPALVGLWASALGLGLVTSILLADSMARQHTIDMDRLPFPAVLSLLGPAMLTLGVTLGAFFGGTPDRVVFSLQLLLWIGGAVVWWLAAGVTGMHVTSTATSISLRSGKTPQQAAPTPVYERPIAPTTPEERAAARKIQDDDSPIPLD